MAQFFPTRNASRSSIVHMSSAPRTGYDTMDLKPGPAVIKADKTDQDTAELYGDSESIIGKWFQRTGKRKEVCMPRFNGHAIVLLLL